MQLVDASHVIYFAYLIIDLTTDKKQLFLSLSFNFILTFFLKVNLVKLYNFCSMLYFKMIVCSYLPTKNHICKRNRSKVRLCEWLCGSWPATRVAASVPELFAFNTHNWKLWVSSFQLLLMQGLVHGNISVNVPASLKIHFDVAVKCIWFTKL